MTSYVTDRDEDMLKQQEKFLRNGTQDSEIELRFETPPPQSLTSVGKIRDKEAKKAQSTVLTSTPIKDKLERKHKEKIMKEQTTVDKIRQKAVKQKFLIDESCSGCDVDGKITCNSTNLESELSITEDITVVDGNFVVVKYVRKNMKKNTTLDK
ncbi:hypothetical protein ILUMI_27468 [Ignelater luminosus]|uniref:Uncharacterized protein n=1 Tax=Ignelater luminosus TaxID=2038154 RepID=A0A8K0FVM3_IGNLU|nr:hypothetical protein ILUMI_27468 [Ignelater luminosus]